LDRNDETIFWLNRFTGEAFPACRQTTERTGLQFSKLATRRTNPVNLEQRIELWREYENVAMHFNELLMRLRTQALGAVATIVAAAGLVFHQSTSTASEPWPIIAAVSVLLLFAWGSLWMIDVCYYSKLLRGAVNAIMELESGSEGNIFLSLKIETLVTGTVEARDRINWQVRYFYLPVALFLLGVTVTSVFYLLR
jgi:hypothetical protein